MTIPLHALPIAVSTHMAGTKKAVKMNGTVYVSPAMHDLIRHAEGDELRRILEAIPLLDLDARFPRGAFDFSQTMFTEDV